MITRKDIESLGWKYKREYDKNLTYNGKFPTELEFEYGDVYKDKNRGGFLTYQPELHYIKIITTDSGYNQDGPNNSIKFQGECKSINELKKLMLWLKIN